MIEIASRTDGSTNDEHVQFVSVYFMANCHLMMIATHLLLSSALFLCPASWKKKYAVNARDADESANMQEKQLLSDERKTLQWFF